MLNFRSLDLSYGNHLEAKETYRTAPYTTEWTGSNDRDKLVILHPINLNVAATPNSQTPNQPHEWQIYTHKIICSCIQGINEWKNVIFAKFLSSSFSILHRHCTIESSQLFIYTSSPSNQGEKQSFIFSISIFYSSIFLTFSFFLQAKCHKLGKPVDGYN